MPTRVVTLMELWQMCGTCEDSCRRMADVLVEVIRQGGGVPPLRPVTVEVGQPDVCRGPEPDPWCTPHTPCAMPLTALADKVELLARRVGVLVDAFRGMRDQYPDRVIQFYTSVPGGPEPPLS